jgi:hypothetical protein
MLGDAARIPPDGGGTLPRGATDGGGALLVVTEGGGWLRETGEGDAGGPDGGGMVGRKARRAMRPG